MKPKDHDTQIDVTLPERFFDDSAFADRDTRPPPELRYVVEWRTEYRPEPFWNGWAWDRVLIPTLVAVHVAVFG